MEVRSTLDYWKDGAWCVGRLREVPGVFSQGQSLGELEENIRDAYRMMMDEEPVPEVANVQSKEIGVEV